MQNEVMYHVFARYPEPRLREQTPITGAGEHSNPLARLFHRSFRF